MSEKMTDEEFDDLMAAVQASALQTLDIQVDVEERLADVRRRAGYAAPDPTLDEGSPAGEPGEKE